MPSQTTTRHSLLSRSATDPSTHPNIPRRATFPNLPGFAVPPTPNPENKPSLPEPSKRKIDPEATDSESRTSSHLSKRRKYSTEPLESLNPVPTDPPMTLKAFNENLKRDGMIFFPDTIAKAKEDYHSLVHAYTTEKTARQETFEAALKRHVRRVNEAEHKLQDMSQSFAEKLKVQEDSHAKELETVREESAALLAASRESVKHASESPTLRSNLVEKEAQLARYEQMHSQLSPETEKLAQARTKATQSSVSLKTQHDRLKKRIDTLMNDFEEVSMKTLRRYAIEIQEDCRVLTGLVSDEVGGWEDVGKAAECVEQTIAGIAKCKESAGLAEGAEKLVQQGEKLSDEAAEKEEKPGEKPVEGVEGENTIVVDATG